jgi:hypothetical protein
MTEALLSIFMAARTCRIIFTADLMLLIVEVTEKCRSASTIRPEDLI